MTTKSQKQKKYQEYVKKITPTHSLPLNMAKAFLTGGIICTIGQLILNSAMGMGADREAAGNWCSLILILSSVILTGLNLYSSYRKVWRCRRTGSHYRLCQLCGSFRH